MGTLIRRLCAYMSRPEVAGLMAVMTYDGGRALWPDPQCKKLTMVGGVCLISIAAGFAYRWSVGKGNRNTVIGWSRAARIIDGIAWVVATLLYMRFG